jgi:hypothetical protein
VETVQGTLTFELGTGNEIVVGGLSEYPLRGTGLISGKTFVRPELGGEDQQLNQRERFGSTQVCPDREFPQHTVFAQLVARSPSAR